MDSRLQTICLALRKMPSREAADWLTMHYPVENPEYWEAFQLIPHVSWKRADQVRLANYYLQKIPFASAKVYDVFASLMSFELFVNAIRERLPVARSDLDLLLYHLQPVLEKSAKTESDRALMRSFIADLA